MKKYTVSQIKSIANRLDSYVRQSDFVAAEKAAIDYIETFKDEANWPEQLEDRQRKAAEYTTIIDAIKLARKDKQHWFFIQLAGCIVAGIGIGYMFGPTSGWMSVLKFCTAFTAGAVIAVECDRRGNEQALSRYNQLSIMCNDDVLADLMNA